MKQILLVAFTIFFISTEAQVFKAGIAAGGNLTQVDGDELYGFKKLGLNAGPMVVLPFGKDKKWSVSIETLFNQKGSYQKNVNYFSDSLDGFFKLVLDYADIPVLIHFKDKDFLNVGTGFSYGRLVRFGEWIGGDKVEWSREDWPYTEWDLNWIADFDVPLSKHYHKFRLNFRYCYSMIKLRDRIFNNPISNTDWQREQYNNVLTLRILYIFNEPKRQLLESDY